MTCIKKGCFNKENLLTIYIVKLIFLRLNCETHQKI